MYHHRSLISDLEDVVRRGSQEKRVETLRRVTNLFLSEKEQLNEEQIQVFDEVLGHLITRMESKALIELSERLAPINNAPIKVVNDLARDDEIAIAGPILALSERLTTRNLIEIAMAKSQAHLLAISKRSSLSESLTDTLIERGDQHVINKLAENAGARFSEKTYARLVDFTEDESLFEKLGLRLDIPLHIFRRLLERATEAVRTRLLALATPDKRDDIKDILASISSEVIDDDDERNDDFTAAERLIELMQENGELDQVALLEFVKAHRFAETVAALAALCSAPMNMIKRMMTDSRNESLLVPCKAAGLSWLTLRSLLREQLTGKIVSDDELNNLKREYLRLSQSAAKRVIRFWSVQQTHQDV
jgi:uncharacterized protein (DUF2336 family)